ncbi:aminotransferase class I/II-fold pyridoxal phosphate-dependent enzyme [Streptomyces sp. ALI-76-A]|uniref:MalY/PatB family protein n=1 Tax=Streptomyces sp. ALI-76-A TaxID=3025736 RepID=UPI00256F6259|nr:aminotransferase class I/II-fold pyridoxal phosphate-dependent enzyme [Streptomyces sp. ALI-76-A]MDL5199801.1 aminotransferase class I/II-fold pyridoxal phosphate-dependent enzyme [Streptomyces sp. ALI-76-A]
MATPFESVSVESLHRRRTAKWTEFGDTVLAAQIAEMDFDIAAPIRDALTEAMDRGEFGYSPHQITGLRESCAAFIAESYGWHLGIDQIFLVPDVLEGVSKALDLFSRPSGGVIVPTPAFPPFFEIIALTGRTPVQVPMIDQETKPALDMAGIDRALASGADTVLLCNPHNPTGRPASPDELEELSHIVARHGARVIADEVYAPLSYPGSRHFPYAQVSAGAAAHSVTLTSASKAWNIAGLKCAQVILTHEADRERWQRLPVFAIGGISPLAIAASQAAYSAGRRWLRDVVAYLDGNRHHLAKLLATELPEAGFRIPEATYLAWLDCRALGIAEPASFFLDRAQVALSDGAAFGTVGQGFVRLNFATSRRVLTEIVTAMGAAIREPCPGRHAERRSSPHPG